MKIIVLGGAGDVGSRAVEELAITPGVVSVTVADRDRAGAERVADGLRDATARVSALTVDATDHEALVTAIRGHDVAASAVGPFFRFEPLLVAAALDAGVRYCSVCDEWDATLTVMDRFGDRAKKRGLVVLEGLGTSPGFTNVGIRYLSDQLDTVEKVDVYVYQPLDAGGGEAVIRHMLHIMTGTAAAWRAGRRVDLPACSESRLVEFPRFGPIRLWNMGHAEPVTVPRFLSGVREVSFFMGYGPGARLLVAPSRAGAFRSDRLTDLAVQGLMSLSNVLHSDGPPADGAVRLDVQGTLNGQRVQRLCCGIGEMREATGLSLAVGAAMLGRGELTVKGGGVFAPEGCLAPAPFIRALSERGLHAYEDLAMTRRIEA